MSPPLHIPKRTLPHAHTAPPEPPDFAGGNLATFFKDKHFPRNYPPRPPVSEGVGGTFGGLTLFNTTAHQARLDCNPAKPHNFKPPSPIHALLTFG